MSIVSRMVSPCLLLILCAARPLRTSSSLSERTLELLEVFNDLASCSDWDACAAAEPSPLNLRANHQNGPGIGKKSSENRLNGSFFRNCSLRCR